MNLRRRTFLAWAWLVAVTLTVSFTWAAEPATERHLLYVATPGVRNYLEYGGHGLLVFDCDDGYRFVKRIATSGLDEQGTPLNVKGFCASAATGRAYISTLRQMQCLDLVSEELLWQREYEGGCDRMAIAPDGRHIFLPSLEGPHWHVVNAANGDVLTTISPDSGAHNTIVALDGREAYLAGLRSPLLTVVDAGGLSMLGDSRKSSPVLSTRLVGPFSAGIRPFTVDGRRRRCYVCVNELLGFEVGDLMAGNMLHRVEVTGFQRGPVKRHGCPSHGIALSPDEREIWLTDATNRRLHVFDATTSPPRQLESIELRDEPGWITFSLDGRHAYPSTGEVIDAAARQVIATLSDENGQAVQSEKMLEIVFNEGRPVRNGDQFGLGRVVESAPADDSER